MVERSVVTLTADDLVGRSTPDEPGDVLVVAPSLNPAPAAIDEMLAVLHASDRHGIVAARFEPRGSAALSRYRLIPTAPAECLLVRRDLVDRLGFLDSSAPSMAAATADLSLRLDRFGYSTVVANHAVVDAEAAPLSAADRAWLEARHRGAARLLDSLAEALADPIARFDRVASSERKRVLVDLAHLAPIHNGTSKVALAFVDFLARNADRGRFEIVLSAHGDTIALFDLGRHRFRIVPPNEVDETFDVGYVPTQVFSVDDLLLLDRFCARIVVTDLDIISVRSAALLAARPDRRAVFFDAFRWADRVISISRAARQDALDYFTELDADAATRFVAVPLGFIPPAEGQAKGGQLPDGIRPGEYVLVVGNWLPHKALSEAISSLAGSISLPIVVLGGGRQHARKGVHPVASGLLTDAAVQRLVSQSSAVVFPSLYEGFGLPIAEAAAHCRPVVVSDTAVAREVAALFEEHTATFFAQTFADLPEAVAAALTATTVPPTSAPLRTIDNYCAEVWKALVEVSARELDAQQVRERSTYFRQIRSYLEANQGGSVSFRLRGWLEHQRSSRPSLYRRGYRLAWRAQRLFTR